MLPRWEDNKAMSLAILVLIAFLVMFIWVKTDKTIKETAEVGKPVPYEHSIYIEGIGKVSAKPDLATINFTVETRAADESAAQADNATRINDLMSQLRALGIEDKDIKTSYYSTWQDSIWNEETQNYDLGDWVVSQSIDVKIRNTDVTSQVVTLAGQFSSYVSGPNFTLDDPTVYKDEAREEAIEDAMKKARVIADKLGLQIESVIGYSEYSPDVYPPPYYGMSYAADSMMGAPLPEISEGEAEVTLNVSITFKLAD